MSNFAIIIIDEIIIQVPNIMNISLTPELEKYVHEKVSRGLYTSASEVIRESLRLMHTYDDLQKQKLSQLNRDINIGLADLKTNKRISAADSYSRHKKKIEIISKGKK